MEEHDEEHEHAYWPDLARVGLVGLATIATWFQVWRPVAVVDVIALAAAIVGGFPIYREALAALVARRMTMELSMTIAIAAALAIGEFFTGLVIVLFVLVAEILEQLTVARGRRAMKHLVDLLPRRVLRRRDGREEEVEAESVAIGETVIVKPGSRIPVDGTVIAGFSSVDQSTITGESMPVEKTPGVQVFAGTVNQSGVLELRTTGVGRDTAFGKIIEAVERAEESRAPIQKTADRLAGYLVYFALACAALTFFVTRDARSTIAVVIVAGDRRGLRRTLPELDVFDADDRLWLRRVPRPQRQRPTVCWRAKGRHETANASFVTVGALLAVPPLTAVSYAEGFRASALSFPPSSISTNMP